MTVYALKPRFQNLLRPLVARLARSGVTANAVTVTAMLGSLLVGAAVLWRADLRLIFAVPVWMATRMALNAIDGMLAREFHQKSMLGAYLNEIGDVVSDAALYLPFAFIAPFGPGGIGLVILLSTLSEFAGVLGPMIGASRRYDGPMGKSDRAVLFGALAVWIGASRSIPSWLQYLPALVSVLLAMTTVNRIRNGILEARHAGVHQC